MANTQCRIEDSTTVADYLALNVLRHCMARSTDNSRWIMNRKAPREKDSLNESLLCDWICCGKMSKGIERRSLEIPSCALLTSVTFPLLLLLLLMCLPGASANLNVTWCLYSNEERLLNLSCDSTSLIHISSVMHGWRNGGNSTDDPDGCLAVTQDDCAAEKYPNVRLLLDTCSGLSNCVFSSLEMPGLLNSCSGRRSNYIHIEFECVPVDNETTIVDICNGNSSSSSQTREGRLRTVYITSPNYPQNYDPNTKCSCRLSTPLDGDQQQRSTEVVLELLDFDLRPVPNERSPFDWLQYGRQGRNWGDGRMMGGATVGASAPAAAEQIFTDSDSVDVDFNSDEQLEGRGFWLKVIGLNLTSKEEIPVEVACGPFTPPDSRQALSCFEPPRSGELYLSCASFGVINIIDIRAGYRPPLNLTSDPQLKKSCTTSDVVDQSVCISQINIPAIGSQCMRRTTCNPPAPSLANFSADVCGDQANDFVLVDYQCIPDSSQSGNIRNICGDDMLPGTTVVRPYGSGFISSPLYPSNYPSDCNCFCRLEVTTPTLQAAQIVFYILDIELGGSSSDGEEFGNSVCASLPYGCSNNDLLQYGGVGQSPGVGRNLSMDEKGTPIYTGSSVVMITFQSDSHLEDRGFWIKYVGRSMDGSNSPVIVQCGRFPAAAVPGGKPERGNSTGPTAADTSSTATSGDDGGAVHNQSLDETPNNKTGLIVGLTLALVFVFAVLLAIVLLLRHRRRSRMESVKFLNESKTNSWSSGLNGMAGFSSSNSGHGSVGRGSGEGGSSLKTNKLFSRWKRGTNKTRSIDKQQSPPFAIFYNEAYKMQDPTLYRNMHSTTIRKKRLSPSPTEDTIHF